MQWGPPRVLAPGERTIDRFAEQKTARLWCCHRAQASAAGEHLLVQRHEREVLAGGEPYVDCIGCAQSRAHCDLLHLSGANGAQRHDLRHAQQVLQIASRERSVDTRSGQR